MATVGRGEGGEKVKRGGAMKGARRAGGAQEPLLSPASSPERKEGFCLVNVFGLQYGAAIWR